MTQCLNIVIQSLVIYYQGFIVMNKLILFIIFVVSLMLGFPSFVLAFGSGAGTCDVVADFSTITAMGSRPRNQNPGSYVMTSSSSVYNSTDFIELTISGPTFTGVVVSVVDENGIKVGTFDFATETEVRDCDGSAMAATHTTQHGSVNSRTVFWIPPIEPVGPVYVLSYVLSGTRGMTTSQEFYRFVRDDDSALVLTPSDVIFASGFE